MPDDFDADYEALLKTIDECIALLRADQETQFAEWLETDRPKIAAGKTSALQHLLSAFGGMGSINDLFLRDPNANTRFERARGEMWKRADAMLRALDQGRYYT